MSATPRTDALISKMYEEAKKTRQGVPMQLWAEQFEDHSRELERENQSLLEQLRVAREGIHALVSEARHNNFMREEFQDWETFEKIAESLTTPPTSSTEG